MWNDKPSGDLPKNEKGGIMGGHPPSPPLSNFIFKGAKMNQATAKMNENGSFFAVPILPTT